MNASVLGYLLLNGYHVFKQQKLIVFVGQPSQNWHARGQWVGEVFQTV